MGIINKEIKKYIYKIIFLIVILLISSDYYYSDKFYPNTFINGMYVGGLTYKEAEEKIKTTLEDIQTKGFIVEIVRDDKVRKIEIPSLATGFSPDTVVEYFSISDIEKSIKDSYEWGRKPSLAIRWYRKLSSLFSSKTFNIPYTVQRESIISLLERELNGFLNGPQNAEFTNKSGDIVISKGKFGANIDYEKIINEIDKKIFFANPSDLKFNVNLIAPLITEDDLKSKVNFVNSLSNSINLEFLDDPYWWRARGPILATWITINETDKEKLEIQEEKLKNFVKMNVDLTIKNPVVNSRFEMRNGKITETVLGKDGIEIDFYKLKSDIETEIERLYQNYLNNKFKKETISVNFNFIKTPPKITKETIDQYKITDLIGRAKTSFAGSSASRITNIKIGTSKLNGILIAPGEEFSAVKAIGEVNEEEGYKKEFVIKGDKSIEEFGGGLCQLATTLFRLALNTGLSITERQNHSYVVGYYGPGLDATIYGPHPDLRFINDTENYILLQGIVENNNLIFELYGRKDGRKITISEPRIKDRISPPDTKYILTADLPLAQKKCTERRRDGLTTETDYIVEYADSSIHQQTFISEYKPWQEVCLLGTNL